MIQHNRLRFLLPLAFFLITSCAHNNNLTRTYVLSSRSNLTASLVLKGTGDYLFCSPACVTGKYKITKGAGSGQDRIALWGSDIVQFYNRLHQINGSMESALGAKATFVEADVQYGYGCPCIYMDVRSGDYFH